MSQTSIPDNQQQTPFPGVVLESLFMGTATSEESSSEIPFGVVVQGGSVEDSALILSGAGATDLIGVVAHSHAHAKDLELGDTGLKPNATFNLLRTGTIWVETEEAVDPSTGVRIRHTAGAGGSVLGLFRATAVAGETFDASQFMSWRSHTAAGGLAQIQVDFTNAGLVSADV